MARQDFSHLVQPLRDLFERLGSQYQVLVTSVAHGGHAPNSAHYAHRAVDVGAVNSHLVGMNPTTWDYVNSLIQSGEVTKIGTIPEIANDPAMQAYAQTMGVELFTDEGTGPHVHVEWDK